MSFHVLFFLEFNCHLFVQKWQERLFCFLKKDLNLISKSNIHLSAFPASFPAARRSPICLLPTKGGPAAVRSFPLPPDKMAAVVVKGTMSQQQAVEAEATILLTVSVSLTT